jgi:hypothetical protein
VLVSAGLCNGSKTRVLVSFELRSSAVKETFLQEAGQAFSQVRGSGGTYRSRLTLCRLTCLLAALVSLRLLLN